MLKGFKLPLLIIIVCSLAGIIYQWAVWTTEIEFILDKCARNTGRVSAGLNLTILLLTGFIGLKAIFNDNRKRGLLLLLFTAFALNHLVHFFFIYQNSISHSKVIEFSEHIHGIITFSFIILIPIILWRFENLSKTLYYFIILHLFNTTYFMIETFYSKIINDPRPAYLHQIGIGIMICALGFIVYHVYQEMKPNPKLKE